MGRVHEVRRSQPRLSGSLIRFGVSPFCRWDSRGALLAGSFTRLRRYAFDQPYKVFLSWAGYLTRLIAGRRKRQCGLLVFRLLRRLLKSGSLRCVAAMY